MKKTIIMALILFFGLPFLAMGEDVYDDNLVIIMDCSGSMSGEKIQQAKTALKEVLQQIVPSTHIGLLSFGGSEGWIYPLGPRDNTKLIRAIDGLTTGGVTPLGEYIRKGAERLLDQKGKQLGYGSYRMLVITDGEADDQLLVDTYTPEIMIRGITLDVIGVFMSEKHTLSQKVHSYREAQDTASLREAIGEVLAEIGGQGTGSATDTAFGDIASLPDELVPELIRTVSNVPSRPLSQAPVKSPVPVKKSTAQTQIPQKRRDGGVPAGLWVWIIAGITIILFQMFKRKK